MKENQPLKESILEIRDKTRNYPRRETTLEEFANAKLNEIYSLVFNKIDNEARYKMSDMGFIAMLEVMEYKCDELKCLLEQMNDYTWESKE